MAKKDETNGPGAEEEARFVAAVKRMREEHGWSQGELAKRMADSGWEGFHQTTISRIEKGERPVRLGEARGLAKALGGLVGHMILPSEESKAIRNLEVQVSVTEEAARQLAGAAEELLQLKAQLRHELNEALNVTIDDSADEWVSTRYDRTVEAARRALELSPYTVLEKYLGPDNGERPEEA